MTIHTTPEVDQSAHARILGIASGTPDAVNALLWALRCKTNPDGYAPGPWGDLSRAIYRLYNARSDEDAVGFHDDACEALKVILDSDYSY